MSGDPRVCGVCGVRWGQPCPRVQCGLRDAVEPSTPGKAYCRHGFAMHSMCFARDHADGPECSLDTGRR